MTLCEINDCLGLAVGQERDLLEQPAFPCKVAGLIEEIVESQHHVPLLVLPGGEQHSTGRRPVLE